MIDQRHINMINRAIAKVQADGYTKEQGFDLTVGLDDIVLVHEEAGHINVFEYDEWEYTY